MALCLGSLPRVCVSCPGHRRAAARNTFPKHRSHNTTNSASPGQATYTVCVELRHLSKATYSEYGRSFDKMKFYYNKRENVGMSRVRRTEGGEYLGVRDRKVFGVDKIMWNFNSKIPSSSRQGHTVAFRSSDNYSLSHLSVRVSWNK